MSIETTNGYRYSWGADEYLFVEIAEGMSLEANLRAAALCRRLAEADIDGLVEVCPSNASVLLRLDPDRIAPDELLRAVQAEAAHTRELSGAHLTTRIIEVPVWYDDPYTGEVQQRFRANHQQPQGTDLDFAAAENGLATRAEFIARHHGAPWIVTMVGFVAGLPFMYQMVPRAEQLQVPKYLSPRTDTPKQTVGHGGCFACIYSVRGAGGYQMFGITPSPIYDPRAELPDFTDSIVLFRPGDIVSFRPIGAAEYQQIGSEVDAGTYRFATREVDLDVNQALTHPQESNADLMEALS